MTTYPYHEDGWIVQGDEDGGAAAPPKQQKQQKMHAERRAVEAIVQRVPLGRLSKLAEEKAESFTLAVQHHRSSGSWDNYVKLLDDSRTANYTTVSAAEYFDAIGACVDVLCDWLASSSTSDALMLVDAMQTVKAALYAAGRLLFLSKHCKLHDENDEATHERLVKKLKWYRHVLHLLADEISNEIAESARLMRLLESLKPVDHHTSAVAAVAAAPYDIGTDPAVVVSSVPLVPAAAAKAASKLPPPPPPPPTVPVGGTLANNNGSGRPASSSSVAAAKPDVCPPGKGWKTVSRRR